MNCRPLQVLVSPYIAKHSPLIGLGVHEVVLAEPSKYQFSLLTLIRRRLRDDPAWFCTKHKLKEVTAYRLTASSGRVHSALSRGMSTYAPQMSLLEETEILLRQRVAVQVCVAEHTELVEVVGENRCPKCK